MQRGRTFIKEETTNETSFVDCFFLFVSPPQQDTKIVDLLVYCAHGLGGHEKSHCTDEQTE
jgi:hypothetical protein